MPVKLFLEHVHNCNSSCNKMKLLFVLVMMAALNIGFSQAQIPEHLALQFAHPNVDVTTLVNGLPPEIVQLVITLSGSYVCGGFQTTNVLMFINQSDLCNNVPQCPLGDDESLCTTSTTTSSTTTTPATTTTTTTTPATTTTTTPVTTATIAATTAACEKGFYRCNADPLTCVQKSEVCNGVSNCPAGDDEQGCPVTTACSKAQYRCNSDTLACISKSQVCDGTTDCPNGDDETGCPTPGCDLDHIWCKNSTGGYHCARRCDGNTECYNNMDETVAACNKTFCWQKGNSCNCRNGTIACILTNHMAGCATMCNNLISGTPAECRDQTVDEPHSSCSCPDGQIRCLLMGGLASTCATSCNGVRECNDGSDEANTTCAGKCDDLHLWCLRTVGTYGCATRCNQVTECTAGEDELPGACRYPNRASCPDGWTAFGAEKRCYIFDDNRSNQRTIAQAIAWCRDTYNASILTVESKAEDDVIKEWDLRIRGFSIWMGITDEGTEGTWRYMATGQPITYQGFQAVGQPNSAARNCAYLDDSGWRPRPCTNTYDTICEKGQDEFEA